MIAKRTFITSYFTIAGHFRSARIPTFNLALCERYVKKNSVIQKYSGAYIF
ncbi:hypothetical protein M2372_005036 [Chryseobacterium sp. BIGb0232]|nr:hypothetical protein [Chryseobacterium sp. BIGb0232]ROS06611.1 hypothetical protein EDF65_5156 [Chryseobacterium nakagawai]